MYCIRQSIGRTILFLLLLLIRSLKTRNAYDKNEKDFWNHFNQRSNAVECRFRFVCHFVEFTFSWVVVTSFTQFTRRNNTIRLDRKVDYDTDIDDVINCNITLPFSIFDSMKIPFVLAQLNFPSALEFQHPWSLFACFFSLVYFSLKK